VKRLFCLESLGRRPEGGDVSTASFRRGPLVGISVSR
jgi:hypothetical protein